MYCVPGNQVLLCVPGMPVQQQYQVCTKRRAAVSTCHTGTAVGPEVRNSDASTYRAAHPCVRSIYSTSYSYVYSGVYVDVVFGGYCCPTESRYQHLCPRAAAQVCAPVLDFVRFLSVLEAYVQYY